MRKDVILNTLIRPKPLFRSYKEHVKKTADILTQRIRVTSDEERFHLYWKFSDDTDCKKTQFVNEVAKRLSSQFTSIIPTIHHDEPMKIIFKK